jgi:putative hemolysin
MNILLAILIGTSSLLLVLYSYVNSLYREKGRFLVRGSKDNVTFFEEQVEPLLHLRVEDAELTFPLLMYMTIALLALFVFAWQLGEPLRWSALLQGTIFLGLDIVFCAEIVPRVLFARTSGKWLISFTGLLRFSTMAVSPVAAITQLVHHFAALGRDDDSVASEPTASENIEALMLAGEEEGLLEKEDRRLIRSVVEFGDKTVRDVMTPRPEIFAVPVETTLAQLKQMLATEPYSRIPVYERDLDHILGFIHARDLLPLTDKDLANTVKKLIRPVSFVPETKSVSQLLKEIQQQKSHIAIAVDEYGSVAGLVTVEDMIEEIVGEIRDEHETLDVIPQGKRAFSVPGNMDLDRLQDLFGVRIDDSGEATTVSGFITGIMGRVPGAGETLERDGLVFQVTESDGRRILRLLISRPEAQPVRTSAEASPVRAGQRGTR